ncbi:hypothetical protein MGSAQ_003171 [marine sediment metagenome]|uniref:Uncharacterized protein n=1 Tax=marine sediment metagenome TaxID=412755 RepID=A0A1B6NPT0_9ZZZZ
MKTRLYAQFTQVTLLLPYNHLTRRRSLLYELHHLMLQQQAAAQKLRL